MDPAHASSPETCLELIEKTMREHEVRFSIATAEIQQATTSQVEGLAALTSQVQQLMASFTTVTAATLPLPSSSSSDCDTTTRCNTFLRGLADYLKNEMVSYALPSSFDKLVKLVSRIDGQNQARR